MVWCPSIPSHDSWPEALRLGATQVRTEKGTVTFFRGRGAYPHLDHDPIEPMATGLMLTHQKHGSRYVQQKLREERTVFSVSFGQRPWFPRSTRFGLAEGSLPPSA